MEKHQRGGGRGRGAGSRRKGTTGTAAAVTAAVQQQSKVIGIFTQHHQRPGDDTVVGEIGNEWKAVKEGLDHARRHGEQLSRMLADVQDKASEMQNELDKAGSAIDEYLFLNPES